MTLLTILFRPLHLLWQYLIMHQLILSSQPGAEKQRLEDYAFATGMMGQEPNQKNETELYSIAA